MAEETGTVDIETTSVDTTTTAAPAADAAPSTTTVPIVGASDDKPITAPADWPTDWREKAAAGDAKKLARLSRFASPQALADSYLAAQQKLSETRPILGKDAKPEDIAAYREALGIPESPEKYDLTGVEIPEAEKSLVEGFKASAHAMHMTPEQLRGSIDAFQKLSEQARNDRLTKDNDFKASAEDKLRAEWGTEYRANLNTLMNFLDTGPQGLKEKLLHGRLSDGTPIGSSVEALQFFVDLARKENPLGILAPSGDAQMNSVTDELAKIAKFRKENSKAYYKDEAMQARERKLLEFQISKSQRAA